MREFRMVGVLGDSGDGYDRGIDVTDKKGKCLTNLIDDVFPGWSDWGKDDEIVVEVMIREVKL